MSINDTYKVILENYAEGHFLFKRYSKKKLKIVFKKPKKSLFLLLGKIDIALLKNVAKSMTDASSDLVICKIEFKIHPKDSPKTSGNRCIVLQDKIKKEVRILLAYHKNDIGHGGETVWWKKKIRENYPNYESLL